MCVYECDCVYVVVRVIYEEILFYLLSFFFRSKFNEEQNSKINLKMFEHLVEVLETEDKVK